MNCLFRIIVFLVFVFVSHDVFSQDSLSIYKWDVSSKKIGEGKYELIFSTTGVPGWQLYSPSQPDPDLTTTEIKFGDSAIVQQKNFAENGSSKEINSTVFDGKAKIYEGGAEWKKQITISGTVPAQLQGTFSYSYGRNDEFYAVNFPFTVSLEGGVASTTRIKIATIDIDHPANNCGDDVTENKSMMGIFI